MKYSQSHAFLGRNRLIYLDTTNHCRMASSMKKGDAQNACSEPDESTKVISPVEAADGEGEREGIILTANTVA